MKIENNSYVEALYFNIFCADTSTEKIVSREEWLKEPHHKFLLAYRFYDEVIETLPSGHSKCYRCNETKWQLMNGEAFGEYEGHKTVKYKGSEFVL